MTLGERSGMELLMPPHSPIRNAGDSKGVPPRKASSFKETRRKHAENSDTVRVAGNQKKKSSSFKDRSRRDDATVLGDYNQKLPQNVVPLHHSRSSASMIRQPNFDYIQHTRSQSVRVPRRKQREQQWTEHKFRPRTASCPNKTRRSFQSANLLRPEVAPDDPSAVRMRCFTTAKKGEVFNRGDSFRSRSSKNSPASSVSSVNSEQHRERISSRASTPHSDIAEPMGSSTYDIFIMGATGVGKTALINQFMTSEYMCAYESFSVGKSRLLWALIVFYNAQSLEKYF